MTSVFDVGGYPWTLDLPGRAEREPRAPRVVASGPLLSTIDFWLNLPGERQFVPLSSPSAAREGVAWLKARGASAVKVWYIPDHEQSDEDLAARVRAAGDAARAAGLPLIIHATALEQAKQALRAGARLLVHSVGDRPVDDEFVALIKERGAVYCPTLTVARGYLRMYEAAAQRREPALDDPLGCVSPWVRERLRETAGVDPVRLAGIDLESRRRRVAERERHEAANLKRLFDAGVPIAMGTDAGNPLTLHGPSVLAELEAMQAAGLPPLAVLVAATRGGAQALGLEDRLGTLEPGQDADLLVLDADPTADAKAFRELRFVARRGELRAIGELAW